MIPADAGKPEDRRFKATESLLTAIEKEKRTGCQTPADCGELERLTEEFTVKPIPQVEKKRRLPL